MIKKAIVGGPVPSGVTGEVMWTGTDGPGGKGVLVLFDGDDWVELPFKPGTYEDCAKFWEAFRLAVQTGVTSV